MGHCQSCSDVHPFATWLVTPDYVKPVTRALFPCPAGVASGEGFFVLRQMWKEWPPGTLTEQISNTAGHQLHFLTGSASHCLLSLCPSQMVHLWAWALFSWLTGSQAAGFVSLQATTLRTLHPAVCLVGKLYPLLGRGLPLIHSCRHQRVLPQSCVTRIPCVLPHSELFSHFS